MHTNALRKNPLTLRKQTVSNKKYDLYPAAVLDVTWVFRFVRSFGVTQRLIGT